VNPLLSGAIAILFAIPVFMTESLIADTIVGKLLFGHGWIPYAITVVFLWSLVNLVIKAVDVWLVQAGAFKQPILPAEPAGITPDAVDQLRLHLDGLARAGEEDFWQRRIVRKSFLLNRVRRGLEHFKARRDAQEVSTLLTSESDADAAAVDSSYTVLKVFIWSLPILGFIGTVVGIGSAVGGFSSSIGKAEDIDKIKEALGQVTTGLALAFDTTLLALVLSILVMLPTSWLQKVEDDLIVAVDDFCNQNLLRRLVDQKSSADDAVVSAVHEAVATAVAEHREQLRQRVEEVGTLGAALTQEVERGWAALLGRAQTDLERVAGSFEASAQRQAELLHGHLRDTVALLGDSARHQSEQAADQIGRAVAAVNESARQHAHNTRSQLEALGQLSQGLAEQHRAQVAEDHRLLTELQGVRTGVARAADAELQKLTDVATQVLGSVRGSVEAMHAGTQTLQAAQRDATQTQLHALQQLQAAQQNATQTQLHGLQQLQAEASQVSAEHFARTNAACRELVESVSASESQLAEQVSALAQLAGGNGQLAAAQQTLAANLQALARVDGLQQTLQGVQRALLQLTPVLNTMSQQQASWPPPAAPRKGGLFGGIFGRG
jgi:biopolymer transport protein ExbB/TolQ